MNGKNKSNFPVQVGSLQSFEETSGLFIHMEFRSDQKFCYGWYNKWSSQWVSIGGEEVRGDVSGIGRGWI